MRTSFTNAYDGKYHTQYLPTEYFFMKINLPYAYHEKVLKKTTP